jgi:hypothetical protein
VNCLGNPKRTTLVEWAERTSEYVSAHNAKSVTACRISQSETTGVLRPKATKGDMPAHLRVKAFQRVDVNPLRRRQQTPLACLSSLLRRSSFDYEGRDLLRGQSGIFATLPKWQKRASFLHEIPSTGKTNDV